jgi:hypothetical protein
MHTRVDRRFIASVAKDSHSDLKWDVVSVLNLSASGLYFIFDKPIKSGDRLHVKLHFFDRIIECVGKVVRPEVPDEADFKSVAVHFQGLSASDEKYLASTVQDIISHRKK